MNTKGIKFLAVLAVLAMAFAAFAVVSDSETSDASTDVTPEQFLVPSTTDKPATEVKGTSTITVKLLDDVYLSGTVTLDKNYVIDLNGFTISASVDDAFSVTTGTTTFTGKGEIYQGIAINAANVTIDKDLTVGKITVDGATAELTVKGEADLLDIDDAATVNVESTATVSWIQSEAGTVNVKGEVSTYGISVTGGTLYVKNGATVKGGITAEAGTINLQGGTISGEISITGDATAVVNGGVYNNYSVFKYTDENSAGASVVVGGVSIPGAKAVIIDEDNVEDFMDEEDYLVIPGESKGTIFIIEGGLSITKTKIDAGDKKIVVIDNSSETGYSIDDAQLKYNNGAIALYGFESIDGSVTIGTAKKASATFDDLSGTFTFSQGSIAVYTDFGEGKIVLADGQELKLSGTVGDMGELEVSLAADAESAKVIVEAGDDKALTILTELIVGEGIAVEVYGNVEYGVLSAETIEAFPGAFFDAVTLIVEESGIAWSGSDINNARLGVEDDAEDWMLRDAQIALWSGKDGNGGTWSYNALKKALTINNYDGTYNFFNYLGEDVAVSGDVVVNYAPEKVPTFIMILFNGKIATVSDDGSLTLNVDVSNFESEDAPMAIIGIMSKKIDGVGINVNIEGSVAPADDEPSFFPVAAGLVVAGVDFSDRPKIDAGSIYGSSMNINVFAGDENAIGIGAAILGDITACGNVTINGATIGAAIMGEVKDTQIAAEGEIIGTAFYGSLASNSVIDSANVYILGANVQKSTIDCDNLMIGLPDELPGYIESYIPEIDSINAVNVNKILNEGTIKISNDSIIWDGVTVTNCGDIQNSGKMGVYGEIQNLPGTIENTAGTITNTGDIYFHSYRTLPFSEYEDAFVFAVTDAVPKVKENNEDKDDLTKARVGTLNVHVSNVVELLTGIDSEEWKDADSIGDFLEDFDFGAFALNMDGIEALITGEIPVKATFTPIMAADYAGYECENEFEGTITLNSVGYDLELKSGSTTITVSCVFGEEKNVYEVTASGTITISTEVIDETTGKSKITKNLTLIENTKTFEVSTDGAKYEFDESYCGFYTAAGVVDTTAGKFILDSMDDSEGDEVVATVDTNAVFNGDIEVYGLSVFAVKGELNGNIDATAVTITGDSADAVGVVNGDVKADGIVVEKYGELNGNVTVGKDGVNLAGTVTGTITMTEEGSTFVASGDVAVSVTYIGEYISAVPATEGAEPTKTPFEVKFDVVTALEGQDVLSLTMAKSTPATSTTAGAPGYLAFTEATVTPIKGDVSITLNSGAVIFDSNSKLAAHYELVIESGATLEVAKNMVLDVTEAALKVSDGAVKNYNDADKKYGEVKYIISFTIAAGYTIYSDMAYALENCDANSTLTIGTSAPVSSDIVVKEGVKIIVGDDIELNFAADVNVEMGAGAKFVIEGTGAIYFAPTQMYDDTEAADENTISGTFEFDENVIELKDVIFAEEAAFTGVKATDTTPSKLNVNVYYCGFITVTAGNVNGKITIQTVDKEVDGQDKPVILPAELIINEGAAVINANITVKTNYGPNFDPKKMDLKAGKVTVDGTLNAETLTIDGIFAGKGNVVVADDGEIAVAESAMVDVSIVDSHGNGYAFTAVKDSSMSVVSVKVGTDYVVKLVDGALATGQINALKDAYLDKFIIGTQDLENKSDAAVSADAVHIGTQKVTAYGKLKTKAAVSEEEIANLIYDATYTDGAYTVYTWFVFIDQTEITDITVDGELFSGHIDDMADEIGLKTFAIEGISLTIADKTAIHIDVPIIIGTAKTSLGAGTVINGIIVIPMGSFVIVYDGADVSGAMIKGDADKTAKPDYTKNPDAVSSMYDIEGTAYATVYGNANDDEVSLETTSALLVPSIAGYNFTKWVTYNGEPLENSAIGSTNVTGQVVAGKVTVKAVYYEGVTYYCDGVEYTYVDMEYQVKVGSVFTAKIIDKDKLEGTPLVNGETSFKVTDEYNELTISGVKEKKASSGDDDDDDGLGLTEILLIVLVVLIAVMCVILILRLNRS